MPYVVFNKGKVMQMNHSHHINYILQSDTQT